MTELFAPGTKHRVGYQVDQQHVFANQPGNTLSNITLLLADRAIYNKTTEKKVAELQDGKKGILFDEALVPNLNGVFAVILMQAGGVKTLDKIEWTNGMVAKLTSTSDSREVQSFGTQILMTSATIAPWQIFALANGFSLEGVQFNSYGGKSIPIKQIFFTKDNKPIAATTLGSDRTTGLQRRNMGSEFLQCGDDFQDILEPLKDGRFQLIGDDGKGGVQTLSINLYQTPLTETEWMNPDKVGEGAHSANRARLGTFTRNVDGVVFQSLLDLGDEASYKASFNRSQEFSSKKQLYLAN